MRRSRILAPALLTAVAATALAAGGAGSAPAQQLPKDLPKVPAVAKYKARLDVQGIVRIHRTRDDKQECRPGQAWEMTNRALVDYERTVNVIVIDDKLAPIDAPAGGVAHGEASLASYTTSNFCPPSTPAELERPDCDHGHEGKARIALGSDAGNRFRAVLAITRVGGGSESKDCAYGTMDLPGNLKLSPFDHDPSSIALDLDLRGRSFQTLGRRRKLTRKMRISGTCEDPKVTHGAAVQQAQGDCVVHGTINFSFKRL